MRHHEPCQWVDPHNEADECQQFQTNQESLMDDLVLLFPLHDWVSRHFTATTRQQSRDNHIDGPYHHDIDGHTHTHGYNTRSKGNANNVAQGDGPQEKPSRGPEKKAERIAGGLSHTPVEVCKK